MKKERIDHLLVEKGFAENESKARSTLMAGRVFVDHCRVTKGGDVFEPSVTIEVSSPDHPYVSRGGLKLAHALDSFDIDPAGMVCLDVGSSTGGFTDVLLQNGAKKVYAVDVGKNQLAYKLRVDERVVVIEGVNARLVEPDLLPEKCQLLVADLSFISLTLAIPPFLPMLENNAKIILLVKPQFEAPRGAVEKGGVVKDESVRREAVLKVRDFFESAGLRFEGETLSPIEGKKGNIEYLLLFAHNQAKHPPA